MSDHKEFFRPSDHQGDADFMIDLVIADGEIVRSSLRRTNETSAGAHDESQAGPGPSETA